MQSALWLLFAISLFLSGRSSIESSSLHFSSTAAGVSSSPKPAGSLVTVRRLVLRGGQQEPYSDHHHSKTQRPPMPDRGMHASTHNEHSRPQRSSGSESSTDSSSSSSSSSTSTENYDRNLGNELDSSEASDEDRYMESHMAEWRRRSANFFTEAELQQIMTEWNNDSQWANATLVKLHDMGMEDPDSHPFEVQWEKERLHGDLNVFRRTGRPSQKYLAWVKEKDDTERRAREKRLSEIVCADDMSMPDEDPDNPDPNWYEAANGSIMVRPLNSVTFRKYSEDPDFNTPNRLADNADNYTFVFKEDDTPCGRFIELVLDTLVQGLEGAYQRELARHGTRDVELESLLRDDTWHAPDVEDKLAWSKWGKYTRDHGIRPHELGTPTELSTPTEMNTCVGLVVPRDGEHLCDEVQRHAHDCVRLRAREYILPRMCTLGTHKHSGGDDGLCEGAHIFADEGARVCGQWRLGGAGGGGKMSRIRCRFVSEPREGDEDERYAVAPCVKIEGGAWVMSSCEFRCSCGQALRSNGSASVALQGCCLGGFGPLDERACDGVIAVDEVTCVLNNCTIEACFLGAGRVRGRANMTLERCLVRLCGYGIQVIEEGLLHVRESLLVDLQWGCFHTFQQFTRSARVNLINNTIHGLVWMGPVKPVRCFEQRNTYVSAGAEDKQRNVKGQSQPHSTRTGKHSSPEVQGKSKTHTGQRTAREGSQTSEKKVRSMDDEQENRMKESSHLKRSRDGACVSAPAAQEDSGDSDSITQTGLSTPTSSKSILNTRNLQGAAQAKGRRAGEMYDPGEKELMGWVRYLFKRGYFVGDINVPSTWDVADHIKQACPKQTKQEQALEALVMQKFFANMRPRNKTRASNESMRDEGTDDSSTSWSTSGSDLDDALLAALENVSGVPALENVSGVPALENVSGVTTFAKVSGHADVLAFANVSEEFAGVGRSVPMRRGRDSDSTVSRLRGGWGMDDSSAAGRGQEGRSWGRGGRGASRRIYGMRRGGRGEGGQEGGRSADKEKEPEQSYVPLRYYDRPAHLYMAYLHGEDIRPLKLSVDERKVEAKMWQVRKDMCLRELFYVKRSTGETRWNLPRGLKYEDLHSDGRTADLCDIVVPDCLPDNVTNVDWSAMMRRCAAADDWKEYKEEHRKFILAARRVILGAEPRTRVYVRLSEPLRFEAEFVCEDPLDEDAEMDWEAAGEHQIGMPVRSLPRCIWFRSTEGKANGLHERFEPRPYVWADEVVDDDPMLDEWLSMCAEEDRELSRRFPYGDQQDELLPGGRRVRVGDAQRELKKENYTELVAKAECVIDEQMKQRKKPKARRSITEGPDLADPEEELWDNYSPDPEVLKQIEARLDSICKKSGFQFEDFEPKEGIKEESKEVPR